MGVDPITSQVIGSDFKQLIGYWKLFSRTFDWINLTHSLTFQFKLEKHRGCLGNFSENIHTEISSWINLPRSHTNMPHFSSSTSCFSGCLQVAGDVRPQFGTRFKFVKQSRPLSPSSKSLHTYLISFVSSCHSRLILSGCFPMNIAIAITDLMRFTLDLWCYQHSAGHKLDHINELVMSVQEFPLFRLDWVLL